MKFDTIIIGGGLTGLTCGIKLAEAGKKCAIVSAGQSAMHFFSGSFDLLNYHRNSEVAYPLDVMSDLSDRHPYKRIGVNNIKRMLPAVRPMLERAGLTFYGENDMNHYVITPMGVIKPTWLTMDDFSVFDPQIGLPWKKVTILNLSGFLDFHTRFVAAGLLNYDIKAQVKHFSMPCFDDIRRNPSEMRSTNIAKVFDKEEILGEFIDRVNLLSEDAECVLLPAVFGLFNSSVVDKIKQGVNKPLCLVPSIPPSVPGIRAQIALRKYFQKLGGVYFLGDSVIDGDFEDGALKAVKTFNHGDMLLKANSFVLATGSFYSKGLVATPEKIYDPVFDLDIDGDTDRTKWVDERIFNSQPFMYYGVSTDRAFHALSAGKPVQNLFVAGAGLGGANALKEGSGAGVSILSALHVADSILQANSNE